jgi:hypothetical protein
VSLEVEPVTKESMHQFEHDLPELLHHRQRPSVSIYFPLQRRPDRRHENAIRWKNASRRAAMALQSAAPDAKPLLEAVEPAMGAALEDVQGAAVAALLSPGFIRVYPLPMATPELVVVADRFHLKPLLAASDAVQPVLVIALSLGEVHLFEGDLDGLTERPLPDGMPRGIGDVLPEAGWQPRLQTHSSESSGRSPIVHGQGLGEHRRHEDSKRFLRLVDEALRETLEQIDATIVLTGEARLLSTFEGLSSHGRHVHLVIPGGFDARRPDELLERLRPELEEHQQQARRTAARNAAALARAGKLADELDRVVPAADDGRVDTLFLERNARCWGRYEPERRAVLRDASPGAANEDLLDLAAVRTIEHGGRVVLVDPGSLPGTTRAAALLRY